MITRYEMNMKVLLEQRGHIRRDEERRALAADLEVQQ
jgi:hypothetical protein